MGEDSAATIAEAEIHDELGGLFQTQAFFGPAKDTKTVIAEEFNWFECPDYVSTLVQYSKEEGAPN